MRHIVLMIALLVMSGCSVNRLFLSDEIDKVHVVKYTPYMKHHRAYFTRTHLKPLLKKRKYLFLYNPKKQDLGLLLHRGNRYLLYSFSKPQAPVMKLGGKGKISSRSMLRSFAKFGYRPANLNRLGYTAKAGLRRYKGVKTLMIEVKDYRKLKRAYEKAIRTYQAKRISGVNTRLPKKLIYPYFVYYYKRAKTVSQKKQLQLIAKKLHITLKEKQSSKKRGVTKENKVKKSAFQPTPLPVSKTKQPVNREVETVIEPEEESKPYNYYLHYASVYELSNYLDAPKSRQYLTYGQYRILKHRLDQLQEDRMLKESSLETLIAEYKKNKKPKFKIRILELLKEKQEEEAKN